MRLGINRSYKSIDQAVGKAVDQYFGIRILLVLVFGWNKVEAEQLAMKITRGY